MHTDDHRHRQWQDTRDGFAIMALCLLLATAAAFASIVQAMP